MRLFTTTALGLALFGAACASKPAIEPGIEPPPPLAEETPSSSGPIYESSGTTRSLPSARSEDDVSVLTGSAPARSRRSTNYNEGGTRAVAAAKPAKDYLPFIDVAIDERAVQAEYGMMLQDHYTRIQIVTLKPDAYDIDAVSAGRKKKNTDTRNYKEESRNWLSRMMNSRNVTRTLIAEFDVAKPDITATNALFSATFSSNNKEGESWTTNESISVYATPYFKVGPNTTIEGRFRLQLSDERQSGAGANVMGALTTAANLIAPTSTLVTYFNAPLMLEASNFMNTAAGTLFGQSITEQSVSAFSVKTWVNEPVLVVSAELPDSDNIKDTRGKGAIGQWAVYLDQPIPSIFTANSYDGLTPDFTGVTSGDVLAFEVGEDLTVYDYIFSRLDLADRITSLNNSPNPDTARLICTRISRGMAEIGFTSPDAAAGVWAAASSDQFNIGAAQALQSDGVCGAMDTWKAMGG